jgi:hypothetical protein
MMNLKPNQAALVFTENNGDMQMEVIGDPGLAREWADDTWQDIVDTENIVFLAAMDDESTEN